jgi:hypothetical protein
MQLFVLVSQKKQS